MKILIVQNIKLNVKNVKKKYVEKIESIISVYFIYLIIVKYLLYLVNKIIYPINIVLKMIQSLGAKVLKRIVFIDKIVDFMYNINTMNDRKLKVYLDTSVVSYLQQEDVPERMAETLRLWKKFMSGCYDIFLSSMTTLEVNRCKEGKLSYLNNKLREIKYNEILIGDKELNLAREIISTGILTEKSFDDCQHIAAAVLSECDIIVSWNFKHLVNIKTIQGVRKITQLKGFKDIEIMNPTTLLEMEV